MILPIYTEILSLMETISTACDCIEHSKINPSLLFVDLQDAIHEINRRLFDNDVINYNNVEEVISNAETHNDLSQVLQSIRDWHTFILKTINKRVQLQNSTDVMFDQLMDYIKYVDYDIIVEQTKEKINSYPTDLINSYNGYYQHFSYFWGDLDTTNDNYTVVENRITSLKEHWEDFVWLYSHLGDYRSRYILLNFVKYWISYDLNCIKRMFENQFEDYFDLDLLKCDDDEVFVDLGAYTGDSALSFINTYHRYKKIYCFEISKESIEIMKQTLSPYPNIEIIPKGAGSFHHSSMMEEYNTTISCNRIGAESGTEVEVVTIDDTISEKVTIIKMDIEGSEQDALLGCRRHIIEEHPKLLICVYHNNEDIWKIARMITEMRDDYTFYLRSNGQQWGPSEIVLFAI